MPSFILAYHGVPKFDTPEEGAKHMEKWKAWMSEIGDAFENPGTPLVGSRIVSSTGVSDDGGPDVLTGFSIVKADNMDAALKMAQSCPYLEHGTIEVAETKTM